MKVFEKYGGTSAFERNGNNPAESVGIGRISSQAKLGLNFWDTSDAKGV